MKWPNAKSLTRSQIAEVGRRLRSAGYNVKTKDLDPFAVNIVNYVAGGDPEARKEAQNIIASVVVDV